MNLRNWNLYKESTQGQAVIKMFDMEADNWADNIFQMFDYAKTKGNILPTDDELFYVLQTYVANLEGKNLLPEGEIGREQFAELIQNLELHFAEITADDITLTEDLCVKKGDFRRLNSHIHFLSTVLFASVDSFFKPMIYPNRFDLIQRNCSKLGIELPEIPHTKDYSAYMLYYYDLCDAFAEFEEANGLTPEEFCACLYDYAETLGDEETPAAELPRPTNIWFVGGSKDDMQMYEQGLLNEDTQIWQCNERTRRGDIIVLYALAPKSCIHSIWRAKSGGFFNPFDYYQNRTTICKCQEVSAVSNKELKEHPYFKNVPIVKRNLQGVNGVELSAADYQELLTLLEAKGCDIANLPKLVDLTDWSQPETRVEKDVEEKLLIPFLEKLGYSPADWSRQLEQKAGRGLKAIPDFVFFPEGELHLQNAPLVIEAKLDMGTAKELDKAFRQGLSYARMLRSGLMGICDKDRLIIYKVTDLGTADKTNPLFEAHWAVANTDPVEFNKVQKLIGRAVIKR